MMIAETILRSDFELAQASAAGDEAAFERLYRAHVRKVYAICLRMLGNPTEAEDVTQDVFIRVYRKIRTFRGTSAFSTWLYRLTVNSVLMYVRNKRRNYREQSTHDEALEGSAQGWAHPRRYDLPLIDRLALEQAIAQLPDGYRRVLVLHDVEGFEHEEISRMLSIAVGTSKSQLHKARERLRQLLLAKGRVKQPGPTKS
jgi:RNA polymerase sigma-70 factor (ECF subfamily)